MRILEDKENFLLNRREIKVLAEAEKNPSYDEALKLVVEKFKVPLELTVVRGVKGKFGRNTFLITGFIYKSKEEKEMFERKQKKKKAEIPQEQTLQAPPTQQPEKKVEEKTKDEKKDEEGKIAKEKA